MAYFVHVLLAALIAALASSAQAQQKRPNVAPTEPVRFVSPIQSAAAVGALPQSAIPGLTQKSLLVGMPFANAGFPNGFRLSNLGGRREVYIPVPQGVELSLAELVLTYDDVSAHEARRSLEILVNDRSVAALALDGKSPGRTARISLVNATVRDGFLKLSFVYSGAATQDRCIDVRYVGDSLTIRPESTMEFAIGVFGTPNIAATAAMMPKEVVVLLSNPSPPASDIAAALTISRALTATGRQVTFFHGRNAVPDLVERDNKRRWTRGLIVVGAFDRIADQLDAPVTTLVSTTAGAPIESTLAAARIGGVPILLVTDSASYRVGQLLGNPSLAALRETSSALVGQVSASRPATDWISFDALGLTPPQAEVFGRTELAIAIATRSLPGGTRPSRIALDIMVAPDGAGEKAVVSVFVNERLLASTVAAIGEPTRLDFALPDGLVGSVANIRAVVQRRSSQGDCRFEPQGYPAEILGSSRLALSQAGPVARDFSDLATLWAAGIQVLLPASTAEYPLSFLGSLSDVLSALSNRTTPIEVRYVDSQTSPVPTAPFISIGNLPPAGAVQRMRFDRGRVAIADRNDRVLLDVGGLITGAVAQIVTSNNHPGLWIHPLTSDGSLSTASATNLDRGDVAFLDSSGVALALSTDRDTLLRVAYLDQRSWTTKLDRFWPWIVGATWVLATIALLILAQRMYRRRVSGNVGE
ncbi:cellulose biosynthesis cyclic di-GMP-binding regulatory protein BcsB [Bradyrhizobium ontarionense]|uniref:Cyclic di-GMP-binding protein n=1 Tax=Bradyrhizobium ontarionense TaxID=2898149 RepID=A0ABY3RLP4_9BRAD|nr:cellulose biosynthesis cyclic di-GMP-binding regulatory protein BcsB [Bradyrhizobium sp. A19]UFZ07982.1 cellulose biosynthesis cyclic di-GMP-binding regulatory protein BcsB [Bradyrhizobium sp. A19]